MLLEINFWGYNQKRRRVTLTALDHTEKELAISIAKADYSGEFKGPFTLIGQVRGKVFFGIV